MSAPTANDRAETVAIAYDLVKLSAENLAADVTTEQHYLEAVRAYAAYYNAFSFAQMANHLRDLGFNSAARELDSRLAIADKWREKQANMGRLA